MQDTPAFFSDLQVAMPKDTAQKTIGSVIADRVAIFFLSDVSCCNARKLLQNEKLQS